MRILIVEDEKKIASFICEGLRIANYKVDCASDGKSGFEMAMVNNYNVILLDYMLPGMNGFEVLRSLKNNRCLSKVIMLTAKDEVDDKVNCLNLGADDYIVKPFSFEELLARIRVILRREGQEQNSCLIYENLSFDLIAMNVTRDGRRIELTAQELRLLEYLMRNQHKLVTRAQLLEFVWADNDYGDSNKIEVYVYYLRQKIDKGFDQTFIHTIRGKGYMLKK